MRIFGKYIRAHFEIGREGTLGGTPESIGIYDTLMHEGLPVLVHESSSLGDVHIFTTFDAGNAVQHRFLAENIETDTCQQLLAQVQDLTNSCSNMVDMATAGPYDFVRQGGDPDWWLAAGNDGYTWLHGHVPVASFTPDDKVIAVWNDHHSKNGVRLGLFQLPAQAA